MLYRSQNNSTLNPPISFGLCFNFTLQAHIPCNVSEPYLPKCMAFTNHSAKSTRYSKTLSTRASCESRGRSTLIAILPSLLVNCMSQLKDQLTGSKSSLLNTLDSPISTGASYRVAPAAVVSRRSALRAIFTITARSTKESTMRNGSVKKS